MTTIHFGGRRQFGKTLDMQDRVRAILRAGGRAARAGSDGAAVELALAEDGCTIIDKPSIPKPPLKVWIDEYDQIENAMSKVSRETFSPDPARK